MRGGMGDRMGDSFRLRMFTLEKKVYEGSVVSLIAPGVDGYFGVLAHHAPLIAAIKPGELSLKDRQGDEIIYAVSGGFLEVSANSVVLLADAIEQASGIDLHRAEEARERAARRLGSELPDIDALRAQAALSRALNRIRVYHSRPTDHYY
jgi:F-type H+-transporting ATPase subunit epsilon